MDDLRDFDVLLGEIPIGRLSLDAGGLATFVFFESYRLRYPRPILGQMFEDDLFGRYVGKGRLPVWFSNLLPEGPLRDQVQAELGSRKKHEISILAALADDLPGAVRIAPASELPSMASDTVYAAEAKARTMEAMRIHFSLAGVQLKFSVLRRQAGGITLPAHGVGGEWILKLPDRQFPGVPTNEHAMMTWARLAGLDVPNVGLVPADEVENIDPALFPRHEPAYLVRRFDRGENGQRIHMEDMAQVFGLYPGDKYTRYSYHAIAKVIRAVAGPSGFDELMRRLTFMIASGNSDMHHKNWSILYPDGMHGALSPAYDLVATVVYPSVSDELALKLSGSRRWEDVRATSFDVLADDAGMDRAHTRQVVEETIEALVKTRDEARAGTHMAAEAWDAIAAHWRRVPLLKARASSPPKESF